MILAFAAACTSAERGAAPAGDIGGTLLIALPVEPATLMPPLIRQANEKEIADQIFDFLADIGPDLNTLGDAGFTPRLAESWQWSGDSLSIAFRLNPRARWHDGHKVTANDIRFTIGLIKDPRVGAWDASALADVDSVSVPDSLTAVVWFARRSPEQFYNVAYKVMIAPEHILRDADRARLDAHPFARNPTGSGPFRFMRWDARSAVEVAADTGYHLGRPLLDRVIWVLNPDPSAALVNVLAGKSTCTRQSPRTACRASRRRMSCGQFRTRTRTTATWASISGTRRTPRALTRCSATVDCASRWRWRSIAR
jgi:peptide/nickel transport system substrate-binding protein